MEIAVWSKQQRCGVTFSVAVLSILWSRYFSEQVVVTTNHLSNGGIFEKLTGVAEQEERYRKKEYCYHFGEPEYFRKLWEFERRLTEKAGDSLRMVSMAGERESTMFTEGSINEVRQWLRQEDVLFIDTASGCCQSSQKILNEVPFIVVILPANRHLIRDFFQTYSFYLGKCFILLGDYSTSSRCYPSYLQQKYGLQKNQVGVLPHDEGLQQAMKNGEVMPYLDSYFVLNRKAPSYHFVTKALKTLMLIREYYEERSMLFCNESGEVLKEKSV